jgi:DNA polymerase bacteriophage-type
VNIITDAVRRSESGSTIDNTKPGICKYCVGPVTARKPSMTRNTTKPIDWNWKPTRSVCFVDFETQSVIDLKKLGVLVYVNHPSTRLMSAVFKVKGKKPVTWVPRPLPGLKFPGMVTGEAIPDEVKELARAFVWVAHNAEGFDALIWSKLYPSIRPEWQDTQLLARCVGLPGSLDKLSKRLGGPGKDSIGSRAMKLLCEAEFRNGRVTYPKGTVPLWSKMLKYNVEDVNELERIYAHVSPALKYHAPALTIHSKINDRGICVDVPLAKKLLTFWDRVKHDAHDEIAELTKGELNRENVKSGPATHKWLQKQGLHLDNLRREEVQMVLDDPDQLEGVEDLELVREVLAARSLVLRPAENKLQRLIEAGGDTLRYLLTYHAAQTGRFGSRLVQVHNLPSRAKADVEALLKDLTLESLGDDPATTLNALVRPVFRATPGKKLGIIDFASIEARGIAWIADQDDLLETFANHGDVYLDMATSLFGRDVTADDVKERQVGKLVILGCIAEGTPILTHNGWKPIETVDRFDLVWDGVEWVKHEGVIAKGSKPVVNVNGVWMTPDHKILTSEGWIEAWQANENIHNSPPVHVGASGQLSLLDPCEVAASAHVNPSPMSSLPTFSGGCPHDVTHVLSGRRDRLRRVLMAMWNVVGTSQHEADYSTGFPLSSVDVLTLRTELTGTMGDGESGSIRRGSPDESDSFNTYLHCQDTTSRRLKLTASTMTGTMNRGTLDSPHGRNKSATVAPTYDILNAGPRNRFQAGLLIVHNCGYGMGSVKFEATCRKERVDLKAVDLDGKTCVNTYRKRYAGIPKIWKSLELAALTALRTKKTQEAGRCRFGFDGEALTITLPSGRPVYYRNARVEQVVPMWAKLTDRKVSVQDAILYEHPHGYPKTLYGGLIAENVVQAICRDIMVDALSRLDAAGYDTRVHVHDEIVYEGTGSREELQEACDLMTTVPDWAEGFPISVEGFSNDRYTKKKFSDSFACHA